MRVIVFGTYIQIRRDNPFLPLNEAAPGHNVNAFVAVNVDRQNTEMA